MASLPQRTEYDLVVIGGGTAGPMAAVTAKQRNPAGACWPQGRA